MENLMRVYLCLRPDRKTVPGLFSIPKHALYRHPIVTDKQTAFSMDSWIWQLNNSHPTFLVRLLVNKPNNVYDQTALNVAIFLFEIVNEK